MSKYIKLILVINLIILGSCVKKPSYPAPEADFSFIGDNTFAPAKVSFFNNSKNGESYEWDFGDNTHSTEKNPTHVYFNGGTYLVHLKVKGKGGTNTITKSINILNRPTTCKIKELYVDNMPFVNNNGSGWDSNDGPDVFFEIWDSNNKLFGDPSIRYQNITQQDLPIRWYWNSGNYWNIPSLSTWYYIVLWDYDPFSSNDQIGYVSFKMTNYMTINIHYPTTITLQQNGITIRLKVVWQ